MASARRAQAQGLGTNQDPLSGSGISAGNRTSLLLLHLAVGAILILGMLRTTPPQEGTNSREAGR